jgi:hypothetical protein
MNSPILLIANLVPKIKLIAIPAILNALEHLNPLQIYRK